MMMPANFSVIAENEMTYVVGGGVIEAIGSVTAPVWTAANVKTFNTNLITIVDELFGDNGTFSKLYKVTKNGKLEDQSTLNKVMTTIGLGAAVYQLGTVNAKTYVGEKKYIASNKAGEI